MKQHRICKSTALKRKRVDSVNDCNTKLLEKCLQQQGRQNKKLKELTKSSKILVSQITLLTTQLEELEKQLQNVIIPQGYPLEMPQNVNYPPIATPSAFNIAFDLSSSNKNDDNDNNNNNNKDNTTEKPFQLETPSFQMPES